LYRQSYSPSNYTYKQCMSNCIAQGWDSYECKPICLKYLKQHPLYTPYTHTVPWGYTYEQCMEECTSGPYPGYPYECKPICNKYPKQHPLYTPYTMPYGTLWHYN